MLNIFKGKKKGPKGLVSKTLTEVLEEGGFLLSFHVKEDEEGIQVDIFGEDEGLLKSKDGRLLSALQTYLLRVLQKEFPDERHRVFVDSGGFWGEKREKLLDLTDRLVKKARETGRPAVFKKPLSPTQRALIHKRVSGSEGVFSQSQGDGVYKVVKILPGSSNNNRRK